MFQRAGGSLRRFDMARLVSFLAVFLIPLTASSAAAAASLSPALGGSGGDAFVTNCSDDEVLVGVRVRADAWVDSIAPRCVKVADAGGTGGFPATRDCPRNYAVSGFSGRGSAFVNRLRLECRRLTSPTALRRNSAPRQTAFVGGRGGEAFEPFHCPEGLPVTGLQGRAGGYVDQLQLSCGR